MPTMAGVRTRSRSLVAFLVVASALAGVVTRGPGSGSARAADLPPPVTSTYDLPFASPGGTNLRLDVHRLEGAAGLPSLVLIHGGRWTSGDKADVTFQAQRWARSGYVVFNINYRLAIADTPRAEGVHHPAPLEDVRAAIAWVRDHANELGGNPGRVGLFGGSAGGHLALLAARQEAGLDSVVSWSGPTDLARLWEQGVITDAIATFLGCEDPATDPCSATEEASPITHVSSGDPPTYLANASEETLPAEQAELMADELEAHDVPHILQIVPGSSHAWNLQRDAGTPTKRFLEEHLCGSGPMPAASVGDVSIAETDTRVTAIFHVTLAAPTCRDVRLQFRTTDVTATAGSDYTAVQGTLNIPAGRTTGSISVEILPDDEHETDETFELLLTSVTGANLSDPQATGTIEAVGSAQRTLSMADTSVTEGDEDSIRAPFQMRLSSPAAEEVTVAFESQDGTADASADYRRTFGSLTFSPGETSKVVGVRVFGDTLVEQNETFSVVLSSPSGGGASIGDGEGTGTIKNDDPPS
jgi:acetyl esterase/lipase